MTKYQRLEESHTPPQDEPEADGSFVRKRKRLEADAQAALQPEPASGTNQYDVEKAAWLWSGSIGVLMTIGSIISTLANPGTSPLMVIPFLYMVAVMFFLRRRE